MEAKQTSRKQAQAKQAETTLVPPTETGMGPTPEQIAAARAILAQAPKGPTAEQLTKYNELLATEEAAIKARKAYGAEIGKVRGGGGHTRTPEAIAETARLRTLAGNPTKAQMITVYGKKTYMAKNWVELNKIVPATEFQAALKAKHVNEQV